MNHLSQFRAPGSDRWIGDDFGFASELDAGWIDDFRFID
jgi:hypothetical protein